MLIVIGLFAWIVTKAITDGRIDHAYARQGLVSPRLEAKYRTAQAAREATAGYGLFGHIRAAWLDYWPRRTQALIAARDLKAANPGERVRLRDQLAAAKQVVVAVGRRLVEPVPTRAERQAADVVVDEPAEPAPTLAVETGDVPPGTVQFTDTGRKQWDGTSWKPATEDTNNEPSETNDAPRSTTANTPTNTKTTKPASGGPTVAAATQSTTCSCCQNKTWAGDISGYPGVCGLCRSLANPSCVGCRNRGDAAQRWASAAWGDGPTKPTNGETTTTTGGIMTAPMEAANFETAVPALNALTQAAQNLSDHVAGAEAAAAQFNDQVNEIDQDRRAVEEAATAVMEQLAARNLDADTMGQVTAAMEQIRAGDLSKAMDYIDAAMTSLSGAKTAAAEASGAASAASATVVSKYGDAASTVASELSGDASFLHSGGSTGAGAGSGTATPASGSSESGAPGGGIHVTDGDISYTGAIGGNGGGDRTPAFAGAKPAGGPTNSGVQHFGTGNVTFGEGSAVGDGASVTNG